MSPSSLDGHLLGRFSSNIFHAVAPLESVFKSVSCMYVVETGLILVKVFGLRQVDIKDDCHSP